MVCSFRRCVKIVTALIVTQVILSIKNWIEIKDVRLRDEIIIKGRVEKQDEYPFQDPPSFHDESCNDKKINILFLKTHKTASSTVTSIFNRFADINNLSIAIPLYNNMFRWPYSFSKNSVDFLRLRLKSANILCNHAVYNRNEFFKVMKTPFKTVTILREPVLQFYSAFYYGNFTKSFQLQRYRDPVEQYIKNPRKYYRYFRKIGSLHFLLQNSQSFDLNFPRFSKRLYNNTFTDFLNYLNKSLDFVMISEYFDEAAVMLKDMLCWNYMDIIYTKKMTSVDLNYKTITPSINATTMIRSWNSLDVKLYDFFLKKFLSIKKTYHNKIFSKKLLDYKKLNKLVSEFCQMIKSEEQLIKKHIHDQLNKTKSDENLIKKQSDDQLIESQTDDQSIEEQSDDQSIENQSNKRLVKKQNEITAFLYEIGEEPPSIFLHQPKCFCNKITRSEIEYLRYFENKFPQYYYAKKKPYENGFYDC
ncbi:galactose-3-O-sulfotransferase 4 isoform X2 [Hydra vulgaris]|uniref:Galactose-3-O-sulfotransferase 4 isoform X2 n=1 Tax=Hydra vulgaris TaxID=6087 RepID=A0ABM4BKV3_HYDVU